MIGITGPQVRICSLSLYFRIVVDEHEVLAVGTVHSLLLHYLSLPLFHYLSLPLFHVLRSLSSIRTLLDSSFILLSFFVLKMNESLLTPFHQIACAHCGEMSHPSTDCPLKNQPGFKNRNIDREYDAFLSAIGEGVAVRPGGTMGNDEDGGRSSRSWGMGRRYQWGA